MFRNSIVVIILIFALPWLELFVLLPEMFRQLGLITAITWLVVTVYIGLILLRMQPPLNKKQDLPDGYRQVAYYIQSMLFRVAGGLLIFPGIMSDIMGLILLIPPIQSYIIKNMLGSATAHYKADPKVIEGEWRTKKIGKTSGRNITKK